MHLQQRLPFRDVAPLAAIGHQFRHGDAEPLCQHAHRVSEPDLLLQFDELEHVAADAAAEAVEEPLLPVHMEGRRLLTVKRAEPLVRRTGLPERHVVLYHLHDVGLQPHIVDERLREERH